MGRKFHFIPVNLYTVIKGAPPGLQKVCISVTPEINCDLIPIPYINEEDYLEGGPVEPQLHISRYCFYQGLQPGIDGN